MDVPFQTGQTVHTPGFYGISYPTPRLFHVDGYLMPAAWDSGQVPGGHRETLLRSANFRAARVVCLWVVVTGKTTVSLPFSLAG